MNPALLSFYPKFLLSEKTGSDLTPKLQVFDETPYVANNIALDKVAGVILSAKRENVSFYANTDYDNPDVTLDPVLNEKQDLPVDATDKTLYGDFEFTYKVRVYNEFTDNNNNEEINGIGSSPVTSVSLSSLGYTSALAANINALVALIGSEYKIEFLNNAGDVLATSPITSASHNGGSGVTTINCTSVAIASYALVTQIRLVSYYSETVNVSYCSQDWPTANLVVTSDCIKAQIQVQDQTNYQASDTLTRLITLNYPVLSNGTPVASPETTATASMLVGPNIWTGSYAIFLSSTLVRTQTDTLVLSYILEAYNPYLVTCDAGLCCMKDCIGNIFTAYKNALTQGSPNLSVLRDNVITILGYVQLYTIAVNCGETSLAGSYLEDLQSYMDSIGCDCNCGSASPSTGPTIVYPLFADPQPNYVPISYIETGMIVTDSNTKVPSNKAVINYVFSNFYSKTFIDDNFYNETETDALLSTNFYTKTESNNRFVRLFDTTYNAAGESPVTLNQKSGRVDITASDAPVIVGATTTYRIDNSYCVEEGFVVAQIDSQVNPAATMQIIEVTSYLGYFTIKCINIGTEQMDDAIRIQFLIA